MFILVFVVFALELKVTKSRVYCQDPHASPWKPLGDSCPINCANVVQSIESLRMKDYKKLLKYSEIIQDPSRPRGPEISYEDWIRNSTYNFEVMRQGKHRRKIEHRQALKRLFQRYLKVLQNKKVMADLRYKIKLSNLLESKCMKLLKKLNLKVSLVKKHKKCSLRLKDDDDYFVSVFTDTLNKYITSFKFTDEMTKILLRKIVGSNTDLRNGIISLENVIEVLKEAILHLDVKHTRLIINLKSTHCLTTYVPGCFCKSGYVEKSGGCVLPNNCTMTEAQKTYLHAIVID